MKYRILILLLLFILSVLSIYLWTGKSNSRAHSLIFFDGETFYKSLKNSGSNNKSLPYKISGGIIPHHLFAGIIIADFFGRLKPQKPETVILIGPDHYERSIFNTVTSIYAWQTPFGKAQPDLKLINNLLEKSILKIDEKTVSEDHAVAGIIPYVKYYLPDSRIVPVLISGKTSDEEIGLFASYLAEHMDKNTVLIAAVDFSHYLTSREARDKDEVSISAIRNFDFRQILKFGNDFMDSPPSIAVLLKIMQIKGKTKEDILYHTNSGEMLKNESIETTSYFSIAYH